MNESQIADDHATFTLAIAEAREGRVAGCIAAVDVLAESLFPMGGGSDAVWSIGANYAFKRLMYGIIELQRGQAEDFGQSGNDKSESLSEHAWEYLHLQDCRQLLTQLASQTRRNPLAELEKRARAGEFGHPTGEDFDEVGYKEAWDRVYTETLLWQGRSERDELTLYFNAVREWHYANGRRDPFRALVIETDDALRTMCTSDRILANVHAHVIAKIDSIRGLARGGGAPARDVDGREVLWSMLTHPYIERVVLDAEGDEIPEGFYGDGDWEADLERQRLATLASADRAAGAGIK